jgi:hypothetical protein
MAPYLLQWEQIKVAKREGYHHYDFGGVHTGSRIKNQERKNPNRRTGKVLRGSKLALLLLPRRPCILALTTSSLILVDISSMMGYDIFKC